MVGYGHVAHLINRLNEKNTLSCFILLSISSQICVTFYIIIKDLRETQSKITPCKTQSANCPGNNLITIWQPSLKRIACFDLLWTNIVELRMNAATSIWHRWWVWEKEEKRWLHWVWKMRTTECSMIFLREYPETWNFHQG